MIANISAGARTHADGIWLGAGQFARLAGIVPRVARRILQKADGATWRDVRLVVRNSRIPGGTSSKNREVLLASLPVELQAKHHRQQPVNELQEKIAEHKAEIEEERGSARRRKNGRADSEPWTQEEREARHAAFARLPTSIQEEATRRQKAVWFFESLNALGSSLRERYEIAAKETGVSIPTIWRWVKKCRGLDPGDWVVALAPNHRGCQMAAPFSLEAREWIWNEYFRPTKPSLVPVYKRAILIGKERGWQIPGYATVQRRIEAEPHSHHMLTREGREAFEALYPTQQRDYSTLRLHEIWCCDGRKADLFCRWDDGTVSRPIVIAWIEVRSRVVLWYVIAQTESADSIRLAFKTAAEKSRAIPEYALLDNSRAFASKLLTGGAPNRFRFTVKEEEVPGILTLMGIRVIWALPFSGRSKPIESFFRQFAEAEKRFDAAYCGNHPDARPEDFDIGKAISIERYRGLLEETLATYHASPHRGDAMEGRSPREVYEALLPQCAPRQPTRQQLQLCLLAAQQIKLAPDDGAVRLLGNRYWTEKLAELPRNVLYCVRFNPEDANESVYVYEGERFICEAPIIARTGFRDQAAGKEHARARGQFLKGLKRQAAARQDMSKSREWITPPEVSAQQQATVTESILPMPKVVTPLRPERNYQPEKPHEPLIPADEFMELILNNQRRSR